MNAESWKRVRDLFHVAAELPEDQRAAYLDAHCENADLRREVESLLAQDVGGAFLSGPALGSGFALDPGAFRPSQPHDSRVGTSVGRYCILSRLATGGMGSVYLASRADQEYEAKVALKIMRPELDTGEFLERFLRERQTLANLNHPNIARLLDGGRTDEGVPYLVMEYIEGVPIDTYCDERRLSIAARLRLFRSVCAAVHFAHQNLVIHRDIKPNNILVTRDGVPKLLDFGIAKAFEEQVPDGDRRSTATESATQQILLTPEYASPEQVRGEAVTTETDVYSLGVVLYVLLTGAMPYSLTSRRLAEIERTVADVPPRRPSTAIALRPAGASIETVDVQAVSEARQTTPHALRRQLRGDIDNIVLMALRKEPYRRYQSAEQFSADIDRYLTGQPVIARKDTLAYRSMKFIKRNRVGVAAAAAIVLALSAGILATSWQARLVAEQRDAAREAERRAAAEAQHARIEAESAQRAAAFLIDVFRQADPRTREPGNVTAREVLDRAAERIRYELADQPHLRANLMDTLGKVYLNLGLHDEAEGLIVLAMAVRRAKYGEESEEFALSLNSVGEIEYARGRLEPAENAFRRSLALQRLLGDTVHVDVAQALNNLAAVVTARGRLDEARTLHEEALAIRIALHGESSLYAATSLNNLGLVALRSARYDEAEDLNRRVLAIRTAHLDQNHPDIAQSLSNLAVCLHYQNKLDEAADLYAQACERLRRIHGRHPDLARTLSARATLFVMTGRLSDARPLYEEALEMQRDLLPPEHPSIASTLNQLADLLRQLDEYEAAEERIREAIAIRIASQSDSHPDLATTLSTHASILVDQGRHPEAEPIWREALRVYERALPPDHWFISNAKVGLARTLLEMNQLQEASELLGPAYEHLKHVRGEDDPFTTGARAALLLLSERLEVGPGPR